MNRLSLKNVYMNSRYKLKGAFTLVELVISTAISGIILLILLTFISNSIAELGISNAKSSLITNLSKFTHDFATFNTVYSTKELLIDNNPGVGTDVILLTNSGGTEGFVFGVIDPLINKVFTGATQYGQYNQKILAYKKINDIQISALRLNPETIYDHSFFKDTYYHDIYLKDFQISLYNSGLLIDVNMDFLLKYEPKLSQEQLTYEDIGLNNFYKLNLNF